MSDTIAGKVRHVLTAPRTREHFCHWPGCQRQVKPAMWGCIEHWRRLPRVLRRRVWDSYRIGQEQSGDPSLVYLETMRDVRRWIASQSQTPGGL